MVVLLTYKLKLFAKNFVCKKSLPNIRLLHKVPLWAKNIVNNFCNIQKHPNGVKKIGNRGKPAREPNFRRWGLVKPIYLVVWRVLVRAA